MAVIGLLVLVCGIGLSRLYLGVHYLTDVTAGYITGFLWVDAVIIGGHLLTLRRRARGAVATETVAPLTGPGEPSPASPEPVLNRASQVDVVIRRQSTTLSS